MLSITLWNASFCHKTNLQKEFAATVCLFQALPILGFCLGVNKQLRTGSESGPLQSVKVLQYIRVTNKTLLLHVYKYT